MSSTPSTEEPLPNPTRAAFSTKLRIEPGSFAASFDKQPFYIEHDLQGHPLFELSAMAELARRLPSYYVEGEYGEKKEAPLVPAHQAILGVAERPTWVLLRQIQHDPRYGALVDQLLDQIRPHSEPLNPGMQQREAFLFVSSKAQLTGFHFDPEYNFLLQVRGQKTVHLWDPQNRDVVPAEAIDSYYAARRGNRDQPFREEFLASACERSLTPGRGIHFPLHAPHAVRTESDVSVSLSITFRTRQSKRREAVHTANGHVRRLGITPPWPGSSALWDAAAHVGYYGHHGVHKTRWLAERIRNRLRKRLGNG